MHVGVIDVRAQRARLAPVLDIAFQFRKQPQPTAQVQAGVEVIALEQDVVVVAALVAETQLACIDQHEARIAAQREVGVAGLAQRDVLDPVPRAPPAGGVAQR